MHDEVEGLIRRLESVKILAFEASVYEQVTTSDLKEEYAQLRSLEDEDIRLFLAISGAPGEHISITAPFIKQEGLDALAEAGLLSKVSPEADSSFSWTISPKAHELYNIIVKELTERIRSLEVP